MLKETKTMSKIELGDEVKEKVTGYTGVVIAKTEWLTGCARYAIQPKMNKDGKIPEARDFDGAAISIIKKGKVKIKQTQEEVENGAGSPAYKIAK